VRYEFLPHHKSLAHMPSQHALVPVRDGTRNLTFEGQTSRAPDGLLVQSEPGAVLRVELSPGGLEFLIDQLPEGDLFTEHLRYARALARHDLWDRIADG
jgi:hypothetical protein